MKLLRTIPAVVTLACVAFAAPQRPAKAPVQLAPQFIPGQSLRYQMEFRTVTESKAEGPIENPQGAGQLELVFSATVRLDVLSRTVVPPAKKSPPPTRESRAERIRLRATYEKCAATAKADTFDPGAAELEEQYRKLEGRAIEFTLGHDKSVSDFSALGDATDDQRALASAQQWITELARGVLMPREGVSPGQTWRGDQPVAQAPLAGLAWRTETSYLRDEPCRPAASPAKADDDEMCAVLLTRFEMTQPAASDPTPPDYRQRGLRTSGKITGAGESLTYISLRTGHLVSATQNVTEELDLTVTHTESGSSVRYAGRVSSRSNISLLK